MLTKKQITVVLDQQFILSINHLNSLQKLNIRNIEAGISEIYTLSNDINTSILLINETHFQTEKLLKRRAILRAEQYMSFIRNKLKTNIQTDHRSSLIKMLSDQLKTLMVLSSDMPFAVETFGNATVSSYPESPKPKLVLTLNLIIGFFIGLIISFLVGLIQIIENKK